MSILIIKITAYFFLSIWTALIILYQNKFIRQKLQKIVKDDFRLIVVWNLFAPNPISKDFYIVYRDYYNDGTVSDLKMIENNYRMIIHERYEKAIVTMIFNILKNKKTNQEEHSKFLSRIPEFKKLRHLLKRMDFDSKIIKRQFSIVDMRKIEGVSKFNPIIVSNIIYKKNDSTN